MTAGWRVAALLAAACTAACTRTDPVLTDHFPALGTLVEISVREVDSERAEGALRAVRAIMLEAQHEWHASGDGMLGRYNAALAAGGAPTPPPELAALLDGAADLSRRTGGLFDPHIGALTKAWGFDAAERAHEPPPAAAIAAWQRDRTALPRRIDLGAYAKGAAVARAIAHLHDARIEHAIVNAGGDLAVIGDAGGRLWRIGIRDPRGPGVFAGIELAGGETIFTSGDYERAFEWEGTRYHHILDPRTGWPAAGTASMTVVHDDPAFADAAATALFVAGDEWATLAHRLGVCHAMRVTPGGEVELTPPMSRRLDFVREPASVLVVDGLAAPC